MRATGAALVALFFSAPVFAANGDQTYPQMFTAAGGYITQCSPSPYCDLGTITPLAWATIDALDGTGGARCSIVDVPPSQKNFTGHGVSQTCTPGNMNIVSILGHCPYGGVITSTYPFWCVVNGQPPPASGPCTAKAGTTVGTVYYSAVGTTSGQDSDGCLLQLDGVGLCLVGADAGAQPCVGSGKYSASSAPAGTPSSGAPQGTNCVSGGSNTLCMSKLDAPGCGWVNGNSVCTTGLPSNTCVSTSSGGVFCVGGTTSPPAPDNGTPGSKATPTASVVAENGAGGSQSNFDFFSSSVIGSSSTKPAAPSQPGAGSSVGKVSCASLDTACADIAEIRKNSDHDQALTAPSTTTLDSAVSSGLNSLSTGATDLSHLPDANTFHLSMGWSALVPSRACVPLDVVSGLHWDLCAFAAIVRQAMAWLLWGLFAIWVLRLWTNTTMKLET